jgi:hypothetical protein
MSRGGLLVSFVAGVGAASIYQYFRKRETDRSNGT